mmetsp:Transcript_22270/g.31126  ORF Transcript_22270/g.31126 Transcript_22270/m.31126 type:complete len:136 (-) Transcript_22270:1521-1928(-)
MRRKHFYKRKKEPVNFSWTLFLIASLQVSVWSFGVWEHPFHQFLVTFQHSVRGEKPQQYLSYEKPLPSLTQQLVELLFLQDQFHSVALRKAATFELIRHPPKLDPKSLPGSAQELTRKTLIFSGESEDEDGKPKH